ncbi:MAG: glycosyltransferase [Bacteroidota bacterium]|nr:glycosyltransferase [Bacteroidota bacterium]
MNISVYITSYNQKELLRQAIDSVLAQTFKPSEIIIVDDCSADASRELINAYQAQYPGLVKTIFHEVNTGITQSRIDALKLAGGDYITYLDGDDLYLPGKLEEEARLISTHKADIAFSNFYTFKENPDEIISIWASNINQLPKFGNMNYEIFTRKFPNSTLFRCELISKKILFETGFHDTQVKIYEDFEFKIRTSKTASIAYTMKPLIMYRDNPAGLSKSKRQLHFETLQYIYTKHIDDIEMRFPDKIGEVKDRYASIFKMFSDQPAQNKKPQAPQTLSVVGRLRKLFGK